jgi:hypothetical protein
MNIVMPLVLFDKIVEDSKILLHTFPWDEKEI